MKKYKFFKEKFETMEIGREEGRLTITVDGTRLDPERDFKEYEYWKSWLNNAYKNSPNPKVFDLFKFEHDENVCIGSICCSNSWINSSCKGRRPEQRYRNSGF
jgi:hypothetical protein